MCFNFVCVWAYMSCCMVTRKQLNAEIRDQCQDSPSINSPLSPTFIFKFDFSFSNGSSLCCPTFSVARPTMKCIWPTRNQITAKNGHMLTHQPSNTNSSIFPIFFFSHILFVCFVLYVFYDLVCMTPICHNHYKFMWSFALLCSEGSVSLVSLVICLLPFFFMRQ